MLQQQHKKMALINELAETEVNHFFNVEIEILEATMVKLREKGVNRPEDLVEFNADYVNSIAETLSKPGGLVPAIDGDREEPAFMLAPGVRIGSKALTRLEAATHIMKYYEMVNLNLLASLLRHDHIIKNFKLKFDTIK